ncbi:MAG: RagB/SusD family nutrient uptake outer membrane protein, partial [Bacteroides acidifaciens]|nr:RagB/SusD family nutrient uptake outer membrane protein [Bacteroides acidifaciens]
MKKSILFIFTACFLFTTSCSDFLDEEHKTKYSSEYVFGTPEGLKLAVNALYALQRNYANDTENSTIFALERGTDLAVTNGGPGNFYGIYDP